MPQTARAHCGETTRVPRTSGERREMVSGVLMLRRYPVRLHLRRKDRSGQSAGGLQEQDEFFIDASRGDRSDAARIQAGRVPRLSGDTRRPRAVTPRLSGRHGALQRRPPASAANTNVRAAQGDARRLNKILVRGRITIQCSAFMPSAPKYASKSFRQPNLTALLNWRETCYLRLSTRPAVP